MITDKLENIDIYENIPQYAKKFIKNLSKDICLGKHELSGNDYANVETYTTKNLEDAKYDAHNNSIDIQILLSGKEKIYYRNRKNLNIYTPYSPERDIVFYSDEVKEDYIMLNGFNFVMLFPHEAHAPQVKAGENTEEVLKAVLKIRI